MSVPACSECGSLGSETTLLMIPEPTGFYTLCGKCYVEIDNGWCELQKVIADGLKEEV